MENQFILKSRNVLEESCITMCCNQREELGEYFRDAEKHEKLHLSEKGTDETVIRSVETVR